MTAKELLDAARGLVKCAQNPIDPVSGDFGFMPEGTLPPVPAGGMTPRAAPPTIASPPLLPPPASTGGMGTGAFPTPSPAAAPYSGPDAGPFNPHTFDTAFQGAVPAALPMEPTSTGTATPTTTSPPGEPEITTPTGTAPNEMWTGYNQPQGWQGPLGSAMAANDFGPRQPVGAAVGAALEGAQPTPAPPTGPPEMPEDLLEGLTPERQALYKEPMETYNRARTQVMNAPASDAADPGFMNVPDQSQQQPQRQLRNMPQILSSSIEQADRARNKLDRWRRAADLNREQNPATAAYFDKMVAQEEARQAQPPVAPTPQVAQAQPQAPASRYAPAELQGARPSIAGPYAQHNFGRGGFGTDAVATRPVPGQPGGPQSMLADYKPAPPVRGLPDRSSFGLGQRKTQEWRQQQDKRLDNLSIDRGLRRSKMLADNAAAQRGVAAATGNPVPWGTNAPQFAKQPMKPVASGNAASDTRQRSQTI